MSYKTGGLIDMAREFMGYPDSEVSIEPRSTPYVPEPRAYHAGGYGGKSYGHYGGMSGGAKWLGGLSNSGASKIINHYITRKNARMAYHETPQARALVERMADTVADVGLRLEAIPAWEILGISQERAREWARNTEIRFHLYCMDKTQHRSETITLYQAMRLYQIFQHRDNDIFTRLFYNILDKHLQNPLQFEFLDPDQIRGDAFTSSSGFYGQSDGIVRDDRGREKSYKVWIKKKGQTFEYENVDIPARGPKSKKLFMLHGFVPEYAGQGRGYSLLHFALQEFQKITDFSLAHVQKAITGASTYATVENENLAPGNAFEGMMTNAGVGAAAEQFGTNPTPSADAQNVGELQPPHCYSIPEVTNGSIGSMVAVMSQKGDKLKLQGPNAPDANFDKFVDSFTAHLSAARGMPLEVLLMKFNQNYSASRGALILFWRVVEIWRQEMATDFLNPIYEMWLALEVALGNIEAPGFQDPVLRRAWLNANWTGMPLPDIDPSKTAKAMETRTRLGHLTGKRGAREFNGSNFDANSTLLKKEYGEKLPPPWRQGGQGTEGARGSNIQALAEILAEALADELEMRQED